MRFAVEKWEQDLTFIKRFKVQDCDTVDVDRIRIK